MKKSFRAADFGRICRGLGLKTEAELDGLAGDITKPVARRLAARLWLAAIRSEDLSPMLATVDRIGKLAATSEVEVRNRHDLLVAVRTLEAGVKRVNQELIYRSPPSGALPASECSGVIDVQAVEALPVHGSGSPDNG